MRARYSITGRLTTWSFLAACVLLISASSLLYWSLAAVIHREDEAMLRARIRTLQAVLLRTDSPLAAANRRIEIEWPHIFPQKIYARLTDLRGKPFSMTPLMPADVITGLFDLNPQHPIRKILKSGRTYIALNSRLSVSGSTEVFADVAIDLTSEQVILPSFRKRLLIVLFVELGLAYLIGRALARSSLSPVKRIAEATSGIGPANLGSRIDSEDLPEELFVLVRKFNEMLDRLSESFTRLSRFSSDIAHELRTPINNMRGEVEIALNKTRTAAEYEEVLTSTLEEIERITRITEALLFLAKSENPTTQLEKDACDLEGELKKIAELFETASSEAGVGLDVEVAGATSVRVNRTLFLQAVANLVSNAIDHTPAGGRVRLMGRADGEGTVVEVSDTGEGMEKEHLPRVFDRFYQVDPSRTSRSKGRSRAGAGLGLSIVQAIVHLHSGRVAIESSPGQGTRVILCFPA